MRLRISLVFPELVWPQISKVKGYWKILECLLYFLVSLISLRCNPPKNGSKLLYKFGKKIFFVLNVLSRDTVIGF